MATTIIKIRKTIPSTSSFYSGGGDTEITLSSIIEISFNTKKELTRTSKSILKSSILYTSTDKLYSQVIDNKKGAETVSIRGYLEDSTEDSSIVTTSTNNTLTDTSKSWNTNQWKGYCVRVSRSAVSGHRYMIKKILSNTSTQLTIDGTWDINPWTADPYEIIYPAWTKFWKLRAMCTTGGPLTSFTWANLVFSTSTAGVFMESITGSQRSDGTYSIDYAQDGGIARIEVSIDLFLGEVRT